MNQSDAWLKFMATSKKTTRQTATPCASRLMKQPLMIKLIEELRQKKIDALSQEVVQLAKEFKVSILEDSNLDAFHSAVIQGMVQVEEVVPVVNYTDTVNSRGQVVQRHRTTSFMRVTRQPNIREKQISIDALYKRRGSYAPGKLFGAFKNMGGDGDEGGDVIERFIILSNGTKIPMP